MPTSSTLPPKQYEEFSALFRLFDSDSNGVLCGTEIDDALSVLAVGLSEADRQRLRAAAEATGSVGRESFIDWLSTREDFDLTREYRAVFDLADSDGDGSLSNEAMLQLARCLDPACNEIALEVLIFEHDADGDGRIGFDEFMRMQQANTALQLTIAGTAARARQRHASCTQHRSHSAAAGGDLRAGQQHLESRRVSGGARGRSFHRSGHDRGHLRGLS